MIKAAIFLTQKGGGSEERNPLQWQCMIVKKRDEKSLFLILKSLQKLLRQYPKEILALGVSDFVFLSFILYISVPEYS